MPMTSGLKCWRFNPDHDSTLRKNSFYLVLSYPLDPNSESSNALLLIHKHNVFFIHLTTAKQMFCNDEPWLLLKSMSLGFIFISSISKELMCTVKFSRTLMLCSQNIIKSFKFLINIILNIAHKQVLFFLGHNYFFAK